MMHPLNYLGGFFLRKPVNNVRQEVDEHEILVGQPGDVKVISDQPIAAEEFVHRFAHNIKENLNRMDILKKLNLHDRNYFSIEMGISEEKQSDIIINFNTDIFSSISGKPLFRALMEKAFKETEKEYPANDFKFEVQAIGGVSHIAFSKNKHAARVIKTGTGLGDEPTSRAV